MMHNKRIFQKALIGCLALALTLLAAIGGYVVGIRRQLSETEATAETASATLEQNTERCLRISAVTDMEAVAIFTSEELGGNFSEDLRYLDVSGVTIEIDGVVSKLEDALRDGLISEEEIFYYARMDAKNGICEETSESRHGLTHFTYRYPEYALRIIYDIYETPDGQQHLISDMGIYDHSAVPSTYTDFISQETGDRIDWEDWGIEFEITEVTPTGITINCIQSGGQQIGELCTSFYNLADSDGYLDLLDGSGYSPVINDPLQMDGACQITLDWTEYYGELPSGEYTLILFIKDQFDESQVHPLMEDYYFLQGYDLVFTIS